MRATCLSAANRMAANGVLATTQMLVRSALRGEWSRVPALVDERRRLLTDMAADRATLGIEEESCLAAMRQAITESDRALAIAAAARTRFSGGAAYD